MLARSQRRVTRGAVTPINRSQPRDDDEPQSRVRVTQPTLTASNAEKQLWRQKNVMEPRLNRLIKAIRMVAEAGNDDFYGFSAGAKKDMVEVIRREMNECFKTIENGTRGSRYIVIEELGGDQY